jgi:hypothetical protein
VKGKPKWRRFEELVAQVQKELAPNAVVTHDDRIRGHDSGKPRQIDITVKQRVGQYDILIAIDCKDYKSPVDVKDVGGFIELIKDIRANKGVMVAANGFTDTARRIGENAGLNLYRLVDTEAHDWQTYVSIPVVCDFRGVKKYQFLFHAPTSHSLPQVDWGEVILHDANHKPLGTAVDLLKSNWNSNRLPSEPGEHVNILLNEEPLTIVHNDSFFKVNVAVNIIVESKLYFGQLPLTRVKGFRDEYSGCLLTRELTTDWLDAREVEKNWRRLEKENEIAITPLFKLTALDYYSD